MGKLSIPVVRNKASRVSLMAGLLSVILILVLVVIFFLFYENEIDIVHNIYAMMFGQAYFLTCFAIPAGEISAVIAISAGIVSLAQIKKSGAAGKGSAIAGLVLGVLGVASIILVIIWSVT